MIKAVEDAFTIIHIRISSIRIFGICARHFITGALIVFIIINTLRVFYTVQITDIPGFVEASIFIILALLICLVWITSWPKAGKMLNMAGEYEKKHETSDH